MILNSSTFATAVTRDEVAVKELLLAMKVGANANTAVPYYVKTVGSFTNIYLVNYGRL